MKFNILSTDNTQNRFNVDVPANISTWGELKDFMETLDVSVGSAKATYVAEGDPLNNMSPDDDSVNFPKVDGFVVSLSPKSTKFGNITYGEMKAYIRNVRQTAEANNDTRTLQLIGDYTRLNTNDMVVLYNNVKQINEGTQIVTTTTLVPDSAEIFRRLAILEKEVKELRGLKVRVADLEEDVFGENLSEVIVTEDAEDDTNPNIIAAKRKLGLI